MLDQARKLAAAKGRANTAWFQGDVYGLPFADAAFDIVSCRFAFHHFEAPERALAEMLRVCRPGGRVVLCDAVASNDPAKAAAFNAMEKLRDPSTVAFRPIAVLDGYFASAGLPAPRPTFYKLPAERDCLIAMSFPVGDDRKTLRCMIDASVAHDSMGLQAKWHGDTVHFVYPVVILAATKP